MDNSNNNGLEYDDNSDMSDKKPHRKGFRNGFGVGIATGIVTTIVLGLIVLFAYTMITGRSVHTVAKSADVLDDKTVQKIDELANYIDEYYYEDYDKDDLENGLLHGRIICICFHISQRVCHCHNMSFLIPCICSVLCLLFACSSTACLCQVSHGIILIEGLIS